MVVQKNQLTLKQMSNNVTTLGGLHGLAVITLAPSPRFKSPFIIMFGPPKNVTTWNGSHALIVFLIGPNRDKFFRPKAHYTLYIFRVTHWTKSNDDNIIKP